MMLLSLSLVLVVVASSVQSTSRFKCGEVETDDPCTCSQDMVFITINDSTLEGAPVAEFNRSSLASLTISCPYFDMTDGQLILLKSLRSPCTPSQSCTIQCGTESDKEMNAIINNVDDHNPVFPNTNFTSYILENNTVSTVVFDFDQPQNKPTDADCPVDKSFNYFLLEGSAGREYFDFDGGSSGKIILRKTVDYENLTDHVFNVTVGVTTSVQGKPGGPGYQNVIVEILDVDDNDPEFEFHEYKLNVPEETVSTTPLQGTPTIRCHDKDRGINETIRYSFEDYSNTSDFLQINSKDGTFTVIKSVDRENIATYTMSIWCFQSDKREKKAVATLYISILDINDHWPVFSPDVYSLTLVENAVGYVTTVTATDKDMDDNAVIIYEIADSECLEINPSTGEMRVKSPADLDRENTPVISVLVKAKDKDGNYSNSTATVRITLLDVNDNNPVFLEDPYYFHIDNSTRDSDIVGQVKANDSDEVGTHNANVTYEIYQNPVAVPFTIDKFSGLVHIQGMLEYKTDYGFQVMACDNPEEESARRCSMVDVNILNDKNISFFSFNLELNVKENVPVGHLFGHVLPISGDNYVCSTDNFGVDKRSNMMKTNISLDREKRDNHYIEIEIYQHNLLKGNLSVTITVEDENDNAPRFIQDEFFFTFPTHIDNHSFFGVLNATDDDINENANLSFRFQHTPFALFTIDDMTGAIMTSEHWTDDMFYSHSLYPLIAVVEDHGNPSFLSIAPVYVSSMTIGQEATVGIPTSLTKTTTMQDTVKHALEKQLGEILGFDTVQITNVNDSTSHMFIKAYMNATLVLLTDLQRSLVNRWSPVQNLLRQYMSPLTEVEHSDKGLSTAETALIAIAVTVFFGGLIAILVICRQWDRHVKNNRLYDTLRRPSNLYDTQELRLNFAEDELPSRFSTFRGLEKESDIPLEGSFGLGYFNAAFNSDGDDINAPKTPTWSCSDTPRVPRWSTSDSLKDAMASLEELTNRLNSEDSISRVSNMSRSRQSQKSDYSEPQTPMYELKQTMPVYENLTIAPYSTRTEVFTDSGKFDNQDFSFGNELSESEKRSDATDYKRKSDTCNHVNNNTEVSYINGDIIQEESTAF